MLIKQVIKHGTRVTTLSIVFLLCLQFLVQPAYADQGHQAIMTVFASGLTNPRGLTFGPDGYLYVAEGGPATNTLQTTPDQCQQVNPPIGPYFGGNTSRISKISPDGKQITTVVDQLPSSQTQPPMNFVSGVADLKFVGSTLYALESGAGCSHGLVGTDNTLFRVNKDGSTTTIADLSQFQKANPTAVTEDDFEPDGTWYSMVAIGSNFYAVEPNHGELDRILVNGSITRVADISAKMGHFVPTAIAYHRGDFYVGNLFTFPVDPGHSQILKIDRQGNIETVAQGLTTVLGVAFDEEGRMYALESDTVAGFPSPAAAGTGMVVRVNRNGTLTTIASGLVFPTAMIMGPDGALYVSNFGFGVNVPGSGQIMRIAINH